MRKCDSMLLYIIRSKPIKIIFLLLILFNLVWIMNWYSYHKYTDHYVKSKHNYYCEVNNYACTIAPPKYPLFTGNYAITDENGLGIVIWPHFLDFYPPEEYGIEIHVDEDMIYRFYTNKNLSYVEHKEMPYSKVDTNAILKHLKKHRIELLNMMQTAISEWGL